MNLPICEFLEKYSESDTVRFHMPGHHGKEFLGFEKLDITEIKGADSLYEADGIIAESEKNATELFGSKATFYSTEGSSQCIRAMLYLISSVSTKPLILAARNVHKSFAYAAGLIDFEVEWLFDKTENSLCECNITPEMLENKLSSMPKLPTAVYVTSPNYLGQMLDIEGLAKVCRSHKILLAVDNAHGAYLRFLTQSSHPIDLGADICCDSAHKTLPVLTGGAYLHIGKNAPCEFVDNAKFALELFGSTSPSYLILASLDKCNEYLANSIRRELEERVKYISSVKQALAQNGWKTVDSDPLKITLSAPDGMSGTELAELLRKGGIECEYADPSFVVLMTTPQNPTSDYELLIKILGKAENTFSPKSQIFAPPEKVMSIREALFLPHEKIPVENAVGRVCASPSISCPPAVPIVVSGEKISKSAAEFFKLYGISEVDVVKESK